MPNLTKEQRIDELLGKALRDREFRERLTNDPAAVATARAALSRALLHLRVAERRRKR